MPTTPPPRPGTHRESRSRPVSLSLSAPIEFLFTRDLLSAAMEGAPAPAPPVNLDWTAAYRFWSRHRLLPLISEALATRHEIPQALYAQIEREARALRLRTGLLMLELVRLLPVLERAAGRVLLLKGAGLASFYPRPELRVYADLDFLVPAESVVEAARALEACGYRQSGSPALGRFYREHHHHLVMRNPNGLLVELHWDLSSPSDYVRFDLDRLWAESVRCQAVDHPVRVPRPGHQLLHVAHQALRRGFTQLSRLVDAGFLVRAEAASEPALASLASAWELGLPLRILLTLTAAWTGQQAAAGLYDALPRTVLLERWLQKTRLEQFPGDGRETGDKNPLRILCAPDRRARWRQLLNYLHPGEAHWLEMGYPPGKSPPWFVRLSIRARRWLQLLRWIWAWLRLRATPAGQL